MDMQERQRERKQMLSAYVPFLGEPCGEVGGEDSCEEFEIVSSACFL